MMASCSEMIVAPELIGTFFQPFFLDMHVVNTTKFF